MLGLLVLMLVGAVAEMATIGAVIPFLAMLMEPDWVDRFPVVERFLGPRASDSRTVLVWVGGCFALVAVLSAVIRIYLFRASYRFTYGLGADIGGALFWRTLHRPYVWHSSRNSSDVISAIEKVNSVTRGVIVQLVQGSVALLIGSAIMAALLLIDAVTALAAGSAFAMMYLATSLLGRRKLHLNGEDIASSRTDRIRVVQEGLGGIRDVLLDRLQSTYHARFVKYDAKFRNAQASSSFIGAYPRVVMEAAGIILMLVLAYYMSGRPGGVMAALPILGALALGAQKLLPQMQLVYVAWTSLQSQRGELDDVLEMLDGPTIKPSGSEQVATTSLAVGDSSVPVVRLRDVGFCYSPDGAPALTGIDLDVARGTRIGIVGATGCGKSTLLDVIMGLLPVSNGAVEIDGVALTPETTEAWQSRIAHVPQSIYLADVSIAENIALGTPVGNIDEQRVQRAVEQAQLANFLAAQTDGMWTTVGERGIRLSGGQRQRIGLARALYKNTDILVLDEATSALDSRTEQQVMEALDDSPIPRTSFIIAHRLSTVRNCDSILVLDKGRVSDCGTWDELMARSSVFRSIAMMGEHSQSEVTAADAGDENDSFPGGR